MCENVDRAGRYCIHQAYLSFQSLLFLITMWVVTSNMFTIVTIRRTVALHTTTFKLILHLAVTDLSAALGYVVSFIILYTGNQGAYHTSYYSCMGLMGANILPLAATVNHQFMIAVDRYVAILHPLRYNAIMTPRAVRGMVASCWLYAIGVTAIGFAWKSLIKRCSTLAELDRTYLFVFLVGPYLIMCVTLCYLYLHIWMVAKQQAKQIQQEMRSHPGAVNQDHLSRTQQHRATKMCFMTLLLFILTTAPFMAVVTIQSFYLGHLTGQSPLEIAFYVTWTTYYMNSGMNFFVYGVNNTVFRASFKKIFFRRCITS